MSFRFDLQLQQSDFSLDVRAELPLRGITAICGASGAGKTSLLRCLAGLEPAARGSIEFDGRRWQEDDRLLPADQRRVGIVFQDARLFPHLDVRRNLLFARRRRRDDGPGIDEVSRWLEIGSLLSRSVERLSGGEQKRVAIARALLSAPRLLLMDEPLAGLHDSARLQLLALIESLPEHLSVPIIYVSHSFAEVSRLADHVLVLERGRLIAQGSVMTLSSDLASPLTQQDDAAAVLTGTVAEEDQQYGLSRVALTGGNSLWLSRLNQVVGTPVRIQVPARDVSLALAATGQTSSILNILPCRIAQLTEAGRAHALVRLDTGGQFLLARITRKSVDHLSLQVGHDVFAQIKSVALLNERVAVEHSEGSAA